MSIEPRIRALTVYLDEIEELGIDGDVFDAVAEYLQSVAAAEFSDSVSLLVERFGLSAFEEQVVTLALAVCVDPAIGERIAAVRRNVARTTPDVGLVVALFCASFDARLSARARASRMAYMSASLPELT